MPLRLHEPPLTPKLISGCPCLNTKPGMMVWNGRLPGATTFGWPACVLKPQPRLCRAMPVPGTTRPGPKPLKFDWMNETMVPCRAVPCRAGRRR